MERRSLRGFILRLSLALVLFPVEAQTQNSGGTLPSGQGQAASAVSAADTPDSALSGISLQTLLGAAEGSVLRWRPDWPPEMPPDLFYTIPSGAGGLPVVSITVELGGARLEFSQRGGRILSFPVFMGGRFFQGKAEYDGEGRLSKLIWTDTSSDQEAASSNAAAQEAEALERDSEGRPVLWRVFSGAYVFAALEHIGASVIESWYSPDGAALFVIINEKSGITRLLPDQGGESVPAAAANGAVTVPAEAPATVPTAAPVETRFFYTNQGYISHIEDPSGVVSALYNRQGMPRLLEQADAASALQAVYVYQWDEAGRLVRLSGGPESGTGEAGGADYRYEYTLDSRGNWIERREFSMAVIGPPREPGRLVPRELRIIRRSIRYEEPQK